MESTRQQRLMRLLRQRLIIVLLILIVLIMIPAVWSAWGKERDSRANRMEAEVELARQEERRDALEQEVSRLKTPQGVEEALRKRFDVGYQGEGVIYIVDDPNASTTLAQPEKSIWGRISDLWPF